MNELHLQFLASEGWAQFLEDQLGPWLAGIPELEGEVLEVGPGPGLTTDLLRRRASRVTAVEVDASLGLALAERLSGSNVEVVVADATSSGLSAERYSAATSFTMLHHVPTAQGQDALFSEVFRLLRHDGVFLGMDTIDSEGVRLGHVDDVFVPVDPQTLPDRLSAAGFATVEVETSDIGFRFLARKGRSGGRPA